MVTSRNEWKILKWDEKPSNTPLPQNSPNKMTVIHLTRKPAIFAFVIMMHFLQRLNCFNLILFLLFHRPLDFSLFDIFMWSNSYQLKLNPFK